jgi:hypothetical protein
MWRRLLPFHDSLDCKPIKSCNHGTALGVSFNNSDLRLLLAPGSSLGGARPKASIRDRDGFLAIAKFPRIDLDDATASLDLSLEVAPYFELSAEESIQIAAEVGSAVSDWRNVANGLGLTSIDIERMASAFEHADLKQALQLVS